MPRHRFLFAFLIVFAASFVAAAQPSPVVHVLEPTRALEDSIPSPRSLLGFTPGDDRTIADWRQITNYFARLDRASDRVLVQQIGETTLRRPLIVAFISAPENIRDLEKYKAIQRRLSDPRTVAGEAERDRLIEQGKTVVVISCSIHSNEIVASQMSMQLAYELASASDADTREILHNTILILIPSANPDGVDIVADWYRRTLGGAYEGKDPPELYHHYAGHDDNRDWFMMNLKETQAITALMWKEWFPQIVYDIHQQGTTGSRFFIPPFYDPPNPEIAPLLLREVGLIGHKVAADLQAANFQGVITNALYDTWWHGGFRTAPYYHNSIGILSEAASARLMTPVNITRDQLARATTRGMPSALSAATNFPDPWPGGLWRPRDIMAMEMIASRSILSMAAKYRADYLRNFYELGRANLNVPAGAPLAYLIPAGQNRDEAVAKMIGALVTQGVEVQRLDRELHVEFARERGSQSLAFSNDTGRDGQAAAISGTSNGLPSTAEEIPAGSYIVFLAQPYGSNVRALFEPQVYPDRRAPNGEAERPYDVAGWTLPMQMGVRVQAIAAIKEPVAERRLTPVVSQAQAHRNLGLPVERDLIPVIPNPITRPVRVGLYKSWTASMDEGWTRWVFDTFGVPYRTLLDKDMRKGGLRAGYDVIILPSQRAKEIIEGNAPGSYPAEYTGGITAAGVDNLRRFVEAGGTLICFDASTELAIKYFTLSSTKGNAASVAGRTAFPLRNILEGVKSSDFYCPGSILSLDAETTHPLGKGLPPKVDAYFINSSAFEVTDAQSVRVIARYAQQGVLRSGWLLGEGRIAGKVALAEVPLGRGRVILFGFRPQHRGQTWGTFPFIFNAITTSAP